MRTLWLVLLVSASACGGMSAPSCPADEPKACPTTGVPSYATDIAPLIDKYCTSCHGPGGEKSNMPLTTYAQLDGAISSVHNQIYQCRMPLSPPDPTEAERVTLLTWFVCGAPNN